MNSSPPPSPSTHCTTQPSGGLISGRISCIAFRFAPLTVPPLPSALARCSMLVVWGYLGRLIPCLMSFETKSSILASEWLYSLWEQPGWLNEINEKCIFLFGTSRLMGTIQREGTQTYVSQRNQFSPPLVGATLGSWTLLKHYYHSSLMSTIWRRKGLASSCREKSNLPWSTSF